MTEAKVGVDNRRRRSRKRKRGKRNGRDDVGGASPPKQTVSVKKKQHCASTRENTCNSKNTSAAAAAPSFLDKMRARLSGGHFRMINEKLYTCRGEEALNYFEQDPTLFDMYHTGYQEQMSHWPEQPVNIIIEWLKDRNPSLVVADFGCGDARLAKNVNNKVFSLDLISSDPSVIACDMSNTPLASSSVDVAIFCLSLMGTNYPSYIKEALRVLKPRGWLLIAEVKSRLDPNTGGADPNKFVKAICELGFTSVSKDFSNKMFLLLHFTKKGKEKQSAIEWPELKPCLYKRR